MIVMQNFLKGSKKSEMRFKILQPFFTVFILECEETTQESINLTVCVVNFTIIQNVFLNIYCSLYMTFPSLLAFEFPVKCVELL